MDNMFRCMGKTMQTKEITPRALGKIRKGKYFIPDCPDYEPRIDLPKRVNLDEVFTGWNCRNCKNLKSC